MNQALELVTEIIKQDLSVLVDDASRNKIIDWFNEMNLLNVHFIFRPDKKEELEAQILLDETMRDFVFNLQYRVYVLIGTGDDFFKRLVINLTDALLLEGYVTDYNAMPAVIADSLPTTFFPETRISSNPFIRFFKRYNPFRKICTLQEYLLNNPLYVLILLIKCVQINNVSE